MNKTSTTDNSINKEQTPYSFIGVDVSKDELAIDLLGTPRTIKRTKPEIEKFLKTLPQNAFLICEATGGYEDLLVETALAAAVKISVVQPWRARAYALSQGNLAKTDVIDARLLSQYGRNTENLREAKALSPARKELGELVDARDMLVDEITQLTNRMEHMPHSLAIKQANARLKLMRKHLAELEEAIEAVIKQDESLSHDAERCGEVCGIGRVTVWTILCKMPELGILKRGQAAHLLGVAPMCHQSGKRDGSRRIYGGRANVRKVFYMAAVAAAQHNHILRPFYQGLLARGKPPKVAHVAVMRKLVELMNRILGDPDFSPASKPPKAT